MRSMSCILALLLAGCTLAPRYQRPQDLTPDVFRDPSATGQDKAAQAEGSFGDMNWWQVFNDETLQALIRQGIERNPDILIAAQRIIQAQAQVTATQADLFPSVAASAQAKKTDLFQIGATPLEPKPGLLTGARDPSAGSQSLVSALSLAWELDFWGRVRSANKAARAQLLAGEAAKQAVIQTVVTGIAQAYLWMLESDLELSIARNTLESRRLSLKLVETRQKHGVGSKLDVRQAEALVNAAAAKIPALEEGIAQYENLISILIGANPADVPRGEPLDQQAISVDVPAGLPSELLERRPDIRAAEQALIAANANIGEARAAFFPQFSLTAALGTVSPAMATIFEGPAGTTNIGGSGTWPLFTAGKRWAGLHASKAKREESLLTYRKTVQQALREVSDALTAHTKAREVRVQLEALRETWSDAARLSKLRYNGGVTSYLEVLDSERQLFDAELNLAQGKCNELLSVIALYKALGGGWNIDESNKPAD